MLGGDSYSAGSLWEKYMGLNPVLNLLANAAADVRFLSARVAVECWETVQAPDMPAPALVTWCAGVGLFF